MKHLLWVGLVTVLAGCQGASTTNTPKETPTPQVNPAPEPTKLERLSWFLGSWTQVEGPDLVSYENWSPNTDHSYKANAFTLYHTDTVHTEKIELLWEGDDIFYIPTVKENDGPVRFKMTSSTENSAVFENPEHDFPTKILYEARGDTMLFAQISGMVKGKEVKKDFPLKKVK